MYAMESLVLKLLPAKGMAFRWNIRYLLDKCRNTSIILIKLEFFQVIEEVMVLKSDKGILLLWINQTA
jgi:hypothetical protein